jgi:hypothetical protein
MTSKAHKTLMKVSKRRQRTVEKLRDLYVVLATIHDMISEVLATRDPETKTKPTDKT